MSDDLRQCCTGSDNPANRCGLHHCSDLAMMGGYSCCCGAYWTSKNVCQSGAKTGAEVSLRERISELVWYATCQIDSPHDLEPHVDALLAVRDTELERVSGYAERMAEMVIEKDREATQWAERLHNAEAAISHVRTLHCIHRCAVDGHRLSRTPNPCVNDGFCRCGQRNPCPTLEALDSPDVTL